MNMNFRLHRHLATNSAVHPEDVLAVKALLQRTGYYTLPEWGLTEIPDWELFDAIKAFQKANGLTVDGIMKPEGETETALRAQAQRLQSLGRQGDTLLAHITPEEAILLKRRGGSGTVNPRTGLLEFFDANKKTEQYIWHTRGDGKVRSSHAERDGKIFSWDDPPEGGHPGEAPNCRCWAEDVNKEDKCNRAKSECATVEADVYAANSKWNKTKRMILEAENKLQRLRKKLDKLKSEKPKVDPPTLPMPPKSLSRRGINNWFLEQATGQWIDAQGNQQTASKMEQWQSLVGSIEYEIQRTEQQLQKLEGTLLADEQLLELTGKAWRKCLTEHGCPDGHL